MNILGVRKDPWNYSTTYPLPGKKGDDGKQYGGGSTLKIQL